MILVDALYINNGGGKILLDYLIIELEKAGIDAFYLFDSRVESSYENTKIKNKLFLNSNLITRFKFYKKNRDKFTKVFCFGNIPPLLYCRGDVYTYFHQPLFIELPVEFDITKKFIYNLKICVISLLKRNTNLWIVQSNYIKVKLAKKYSIFDDQILVVPFFPNTSIFSNEVRQRNTFFYPSNASPHKNHVRLIEAFCKFQDKYHVGRLVLTLDCENNILMKLLKEKVQLGYNIVNIGFVDRDIVTETYYSSEFVIFPSLTESFGLGLVEAVECGCKVIGADLPYTYEVCLPSLVFDPFKVESIFLAFEKTQTANLVQTIPQIKNNILALLTLLNDKDGNEGKKE
jgi:glycosyltransferase involved in cell wall biosynthesis